MRAGDKPILLRVGWVGTVAREAEDRSCEGVSETGDDESVAVCVEASFVVVVSSFVVWVVMPVVYVLVSAEVFLSVAMKSVVMVGRCGLDLGEGVS